MKRILQNIVKLKKISTIKDFRFGLHFLPTTMKQRETKYARLTPEWAPVEESWMCRFIVCIIYIHRYTSFLTEAALTKAVSTKAGSSRKRTRKLTEMSRTGNLLLLISSLILRCFAKTFSFIVYFYILETHKL